MDPLWNNIFRKKLDEDSLSYFLKHLPTFSELSHKQLGILESIVHQRSCKTHEIIFEEGDPGSGMYMIRSGSVRIFARNTDGSEDALATLEAGDFFGETTLTAPAPRTASARTLEATELVGLFRSDLLDLSERQASVTNSILFGLTRVVSERLQAASHENRRLQNLLGEQPSPESSET